MLRFGASLFAAALTTLFTSTAFAQGNLVVWWNKGFYPAEDAVTTILRNSLNHPEIEQHEIQTLLWAIIARAKDDPRAAARVLLPEYGWDDSQFSCLDNLWEGESGWNYRAENPSSGAYGIPQSLPGSKMASVAQDWRENPVTQITWGLQYIESRYGSPCSAWAQWQSRSPHWY